MKMKCTSLIIALLACTPWTHAAIEPVTLILGSSSPEYTIPAGKVLIVEHAMGSSTGGNLILRRNLVLDNGNGGLIFLDINLNDTYSDGTLHTLERPLKLKGGTKVQRNQSPLSSNSDLFGLLVDGSDLFASVPNEIEEGLVSAGVFSGTVVASSARPARAVVEKSADATTYVADSSATATRTSSTDIGVTTSTDDALKLIRVDLRARPSE